MKYNFIIDDASFGTVKNLVNTLPANVLSDFIIDTLKDNIYRFNIHNISNLYVLVGTISSERYLKKGELTFKKMLNTNQYTYLKKHRRIILGCMEVNKSEIRDNIYYIDWIDTFVPKHNIAQIMMKKYNNNKSYIDDVLIPREFFAHSINYWIKKNGWDNYEDYRDNYKKALNDDYHIDEIKSEIKWDVLYNKLEYNIKKENMIWDKSYDNITDTITELYSDYNYFINAVKLDTINDINYYFYLKKRINILKKILKNKRNFNKEELSIEAFKPSRLTNRLMNYGNDYEFN